MNISEGQRGKIRKALEEGQSVSIRLSHSDLVGEDLLAFTRAQLLKIQKALQAGK